MKCKNAKQKMFTKLDSEQKLTLVVSAQSFAMGTPTTTPPATPTTARPATKEDDHVFVILNNRVPEVNAVFWVIKVLSTTTGETFADYLNDTVGLGLPNTTYIMMSLLIVAMVGQFFTPRYNVFVYWLVVVLISVVGTLVTDNLTDGLGLELWVSTVIFSILLFVTFGAWYYKERTLDIHLIVTRRREAFYWVAVLFTFSLGTASGDLITEGFGLGYWKGTLLFAGLILAVAIARFALKVNGVLCFWIAYILTRPLGASIGDLLSQDPADGGLGAGTTVTSIVFLAVIVLLCVYLHIKVSRQRKVAEAEASEKDEGDMEQVPDEDV